MNSVQRSNHKAIGDLRDMVILSLIAGEEEYAYKFTIELVHKVKKIYKVK